MSATINNIGLYLSARRGLQTNYKLVLCLYPSDHTTGLPITSLPPISVSKREVVDIDHEDWYIFYFNSPVDLSEGYYNFVLYQEPSTPYDDVDFESNFVEWIHTDDIINDKDLFSFSSEQQYASYQYGYGYEDIYGYGYGIGSSNNYFDVLGFDGILQGEGLGNFESKYPSEYGYGYGYESVYLRSNLYVNRCFKIYNNFNDIEYVNTEYDSYNNPININLECARINLPSAESSSVVIDNRQKFIKSERHGIDVSDNVVTLEDSGGRLYQADLSNFEFIDKYDWNESNFYLPNNDLNDADIQNPTNNLNQNQTWMIAAPYYSGLSFSVDSGSKWINDNKLKNYDTKRNFSAVLMDQNCQYVLAFDNSGINENGKVFYAEINENDIINNNLSWQEIDRLTDSEGGLVVTSVLQINSNNIMVGTDRGVYQINGDIKTSFWINKDNGLIDHPHIYDISASYYPEYIYGYGYGYATGYDYSSLNAQDYFDVLGIDGRSIGYGYYPFEVTNIGSLKFGYGYEQLYDYGNVKDIFIAIGEKAYIWNDLTLSWDILASESEWDNKTCYSILPIDNNVYIGSDNGLLRTVDNGFGYISILGNNIDDDFYSYGLSNSKINSIKSNVKNNSEIFVAQKNGFFLSQNNGGNFHYLSKNLDDHYVKKILLNPLNNRKVYVVTKTKKFSNHAISIIIDSSGSMAANDSNNYRLLMAKKIVNEVYNNAEDIPYFEIVKIGLKENAKISNDQEYIEGAEILTKSTYLESDSFESSGFTANLSTVLSQIDNCAYESLYRTPLFDTVSIFAKAFNQYGAYWEYENGEYVINDVKSDKFYKMRKTVILITDGYDTVRHNANLTTEDISASDNNIISKLNDYSNMRCDMYVVGVGHDINYNNLETLKQLHQSSYLYLSEYDDLIYQNSYGYDTNDIEYGTVNYLDVSDIILLKEKLYNREGTLNKIIDLNQICKISSISLQAIVPPETDCQYRYRISFDKDKWSSWSEYYSYLKESTINNTGKYINIEIYLNSNKTTYSPYVENITVNYLDPSSSNIFYKSESSDNITQLYIDSVDDFTLGNLSKDDVDMQFGFIKSDSYYMGYSKNLNLNKRNIVDEKNKIEMITEDGFFYYTEPWVEANYNTYIYDEKDNKISAYNYYAIPNKGMLVFYEQQIDNGIYKKYKIETSKSNKNRISLNIKNFDNTNKIDLHDISWMKYNSGIGEIYRKPLPFSNSQIYNLSNYGKLYDEFHQSSRGLSTSFMFQYINKDEDFAGWISFTTGQYYCFEDGNKKYYSQNTFIDKFNISNSFNSSFVEIDHNSQSSSVTIVDANKISNAYIHYQANFDVNIDKNTSLIFNLGKDIGVPTYIKQNNLLFEPEDQIHGNLESSFIFGVNVESLDDFNKVVEPSFKLIGLDHKKIVILSPTTISESSLFDFSIVIVDNNGIIDEQFEGNIEIQFDPENFAYAHIYNVEFTKEDRGHKKINAFCNLNSGNGRIIANYENSSTTFKSNPIIITSDIVLWGDMNVSSLFSDGRQDIDFIANYARNISNLDFICVSEDATLLDQNIYNLEWKEILTKSKQKSRDGLFVFPGFKYRSTMNQGERVVMFTDDNNIPENMLIDIIGSDGLNISKLIDYIDGYEYITIPIHSAYYQDNKSERQKQNIFNNRGFDFSQYTNIPSSISINADSVAEIYSEHGFCENQNNYISNNGYFAENIETYYLNYALKIGKRFGFVANSGGYTSRPGYYIGDKSKQTKLPNTKYGNDLTSFRGLTAVIVDDINKNEISNSIKTRKCYCTTGAKMHLKYYGKYNNEIIDMGSVKNIQDGIDANGYIIDNIELYCNIYSDKAPIEKIEVIRTITDEDVSKVYEVNLMNTDVYDYNLSLFDDTSTLGNKSIDNVKMYEKELCYYIRITQKDQHIAWTSPIWFNFGRDEGIILSASQSSNLKEVSFIKSNLNNKDFTGKISSTESQNNPVQHYDVNNTFPLEFNEPLSVVSTGPYVQSRQTYSNAFLKISDNTLWSGGFRIFKDQDTHIFYGSSYIRFIKDSNEENVLYIGNQYNVNSEDILSEENEYKYISDWDMYSDIDSDKYMRNKLFGYITQYINNSNNIKNQYVYDIDTQIFQPDGVQVVRDPFLYKENNLWNLVYISYDDNAYPERNLSSNTYEYPIEKEYNVEDDSNFVYRDGRVEDFAGLLEQNTYSSDRHRLYLTNGSSRNFSNGIKINNLYNNGNTNQNIIHPSSPNLIKTDSGYRIYYIGWFLGKNGENIIGIFAHDFSFLDTDLYNQDSNKNTYLCFCFTDNYNSLPDNYNYRKCSSENKDFIWNHFNDKENHIEDSNLLDAIHPSYALGFTWLKIIKNDNIYYAFYNRNNPKDQDGNIISDKGTGILYSENGIDFYEYNQDENKILSNIKNKIYVDINKINNIWYMSYCDTSDEFWNNKTRKFKYNAFIWKDNLDF